MEKNKKKSCRSRLVPISNTRDNRSFEDKTMYDIIDYLPPQQPRNYYPSSIVRIFIGSKIILFCCNADAYRYIVFEVGGDGSARIVCRI